jgi:hypothetical protein
MDEGGYRIGRVLMWILAPAAKRLDEKMRLLDKKDMEGEAAAHRDESFCCQ